MLCAFVLRPACPNSLARPPSGHPEAEAAFVFACIRPRRLAGSVPPSSSRCAFVFVCAPLDFVCPPPPGLHAIVCFHSPHPACLILLSNFDLQPGIVSASLGMLISHASERLKLSTAMRVVRFGVATPVFGAGPSVPEESGNPWADVSVHSLPLPSLVVMHSAPLLARCDFLFRYCFVFVRRSLCLQVGRRMAQSRTPAALPWKCPLYRSPVRNLLPALSSRITCILCFSPRVC
jgi:hypothetical protein